MKSDKIDEYVKYRLQKAEDKESDIFTSAENHLPLKREFNAQSFYSKNIPLGRGLRGGENR